MRSRGVAPWLVLVVVALISSSSLCSLAVAQDEHTHGGPVDMPHPPREAYAVVGSSAVAILRTAVHATANSERMPLVEALQRLITLEVLRQNLAAQGHDPANVSDADLDKAIVDAKAALAGQGAPPEQVAALDSMRDSLRVSLAFSRFVEGQVKDDALVAEFESRRLAFAGELRLRAISIRIDPAAGGENTARAQLMALRARLGDAPTDDAFAALASTASHDPNAVLTGGDLDWQSRRTPTIPMSMIDAAIKLGRPGLVPEAVVTSRAVHLVYVTKVRVGQAATLENLLPRMRAEQRAQLARELMGRWTHDTPVRMSEDAPHMQQQR